MPEPWPNFTSIRKADMVLARLLRVLSIGPWMDSLHHFLKVGGFIPGAKVGMLRSILVSLAAATILSAAAADPKVVNDGYGDFVLVPGGSFKMGDNFGDGEDRERPVHTVDVDSFYIGKFEVTNGEWKKFRDDPAMTIPSSGRAVAWSRRHKCRIGRNRRTMAAARPIATTIPCLE